MCVCVCVCVHAHMHARARARAREREREREEKTQETQARRWCGTQLNKFVSCAFSTLGHMPYPGLERSFQVIGKKTGGHTFSYSILPIMRGDSTGYKEEVYLK